jgi:hypothetical protein
VSLRHVGQEARESTDLPAEVPSHFARSLAAVLGSTVMSLEAVRLNQ